MSSLLQEIISANESINIPDDIDSFTEKSQWAFLKQVRYSSNTKNRDALAIWTKWVVSIWLIYVAIFLMFNECFLKTSDNVLLMLLGTTTVNVLGLSYIVLKGYFESISNNEV